MTPGSVDSLVRAQLAEDGVAIRHFVQIDEVAERGLLRRYSVPIICRILEEAFGSETPAAVFVNPQGQPQMIGMIDQGRERHREFAALHVGLEILAGEEDAQIIARADAGDGRVMARIGVGPELRREHRVDDDFGIGRRHEIVFLVHERKEGAEVLRYEARPEISERDADLRFHATPQKGTSLHPPSAGTRALRARPAPSPTRGEGKRGVSARVIASV
jgi:hypothetical protein